MIIDPNQKKWDKIIESKGKLFDLKLLELWQYRDLVVLFVKRDFISVYKQTILGPLWHLIKPLMTTVIFTIVFGRIAQISTDGLPQFLFYMAGNILWTLFAEVSQLSSATFINNAGVFGKIYFPRLAVPISIVISKLISFSIQFVLFLGFIIYFIIQGSTIQPNLYILLTPLLLIMMGTISLGFGVIISALTTRYRDLQVLANFGISLLMYASPIVYPLSVVPDKYKLLLLANPITAIIETFRFAYLGAGTFNLTYLMYSIFFSVVIFCFGVAMFNKIERTFMDTI